MDFTTKVPIANYEHPINYNSRLLSLGSCFADNMGTKLDYFKFRTATNPFGVIFNPFSIENLVRRAVNQELFTENDIFFHNELWHCYEVHSVLSNPVKDTFLERLNTTLQNFAIEIANATHCILTYGTAWVYRHKPSNLIVANCHKIPQKEFSKEILSPEAVRQSLQHTMTLIQSGNPTCQFIVTVSPVRHIKDGFPENQRSKAHLITATHDLAFGNYFPAYEIMMDELRDYRFYANGLLHPNETAINYIWERFCGHYADPDCFDTMQEIDTIQKGLLHRPFNPDTQSHQRFLQGLQQKIAILQSQYPHFRF